jgi:micrococcal nuclease
MKSRKIIVWVIAVGWIVAGGVFAGENLKTGKCVEVIDGDTLVIECEKNQKTVNIDGIDCPELEQPWGKQVRSFVRGLVRGENVEIEILESTGDTVLARVTVDGIDLSELLVSRGLAWVPDGSTDADLVELSAKARELPCGLWMDADPQPPWEFREAAS